MRTRLANALGVAICAACWPVIELHGRVIDWRNRRGL